MFKQMYVPVSGLLGPLSDNGGFRIARRPVVNQIMAFNNNVLSSGESEKVTPHEYNVFVCCSLAGGLVGLLQDRVVEVFGAGDTIQEEILVVDPGWHPRQRILG